MTRFTPAYIGRVAALAVIYILAARAGLRLDALSGFVTLVWPPTGIALAALLLGGFGLWPGVFAGALIANVLTGAPVAVATGIAIGNTIEAVLGTYAVRRIEGFNTSLSRVPDALGLVFLAAALSTVVAATIGVGSLHLGGVVGREQIIDTWKAWWLGDAIGAVLVAPVILVWFTRPRPAPPSGRMLEAIVLAVSVIVASLLIFVIPATHQDVLFNQAYILYPLLMWATVRFNQHGSVAITFLVSVIAIWGTANGHGPFTAGSLHASLFGLQTFMGVTAATFLVLGASTAERDHAVEDISAAHEVAANANRAKAEFLAVMSHELRTPLNAIAGYSDLLSMGIDGPLSAKQSDAIARIRRNQQHLLGLIDEVLTFARIEAGSSNLESVPISVNDAFDSLEPLVLPQLQQKELTMDRDRLPDDLVVRADPAKLRQVLINVVVNAIKFTPSGGRITLSARRDADCIVLMVSDTGIGVAPDKIARLFEPFFQVDSRMTREYEGVGLGLPIARDLARAMGGDISFESEVGKGSTVSVTMPTPDAG